MSSHRGHKEASINISNAIYLEKASLPSYVLDYLRQRLTMQNPLWLENKRRNRWNGGTPEILHFSNENQDTLILPRGYARQLEHTLDYYHIPFKIFDKTRTLQEVGFDFNGKLYPYQAKSAKELSHQRFGVLQAPPGAGKTIIAFVVMAERKQPTLVVVHTKELMYQWQARAVEFLGMNPDEIGLIGDGNFTIGHKLTIAIINSLYQCADEVRKHIGHLIVDECHHIPAKTFTEAVSAFDCAYMLGLSATPYRRDSLTKIIYLYMGDRCHEITTHDLQCINRIMTARLIPRYTDFDYFFTPDDYQAMLTALAKDPDRNDMIIKDVLHQVKSDAGIALVISDRVSHCQRLYEGIRANGIENRLLTGKVPAKQRSLIVQDLNGGKVRVLVATAQLIGEGFDLPEISSIFLTTPIKFTGRVKQYIGRVLRIANGKQQALIYDYMDRPGVLVHSFKSRCHAYREMGVQMSTQKPVTPFEEKGKGKPLAPEKETLPPLKAVEALGKEAKVDGEKTIEQGIIKFKAKDGKI